MSLDLRRTQRYLRRATWIIAALAVIYLVRRYDRMPLPESNCSPLLRFVPGDELLIDTTPPGYGPGDAVLFTGAGSHAGTLFLGLVERVQPEGAARGDVERVWIVTDNRDCPGVGSDELDWVGVGRLRARVLFAWPW